MESLCLFCLMSACGEVGKNLAVGEGERGGEGGITESKQGTLSTADGVLSYLLLHSVCVIFITESD